MSENPLTPEQEERQLKMMEFYKRFLEVDFGFETGINWTFQKFEEHVNRLKEQYIKYLKSIDKDS